MVRRAKLSNTFTKGVLDPLLAERIDLAHYYNSLSASENAVFLPQGGIGRRPGFSLASGADLLAAGVKRRLRRRIAPLALSQTMITAHNGGDPTALVDQSTATLFTTAPVSGLTFLVFEVDLGAPSQVDFVDLLAFSAGSQGFLDAIGIEYFDGLAWRAFAGRCDLGTVPRTRRFAQWPGGNGGAPVVARYWRAVVYGAAGAGAVSIGGLAMWRERRQISPARHISFARSAGEVYELILTERNIDVYDNQRYVASIVCHVAPQQIAEIDFAQSLDTLLLFNEDLPPTQIVRQGASDEWNFSYATFTNRPALTDGTAYSGAADEVQSIACGSLAPGDQLIVYVQEFRAAPFAFSSSAALPAQIAAAIEGVYGAASGSVIATLADAASNTVRLQMTGALGGRAHPLVQVAVTNRDDRDPLTTIERRGLDPARPLWDLRTGWPRCGAIVQGRLLLAGFRAAPSSWAASRAGLLFDFQILSDPMTADLAFVRSIDSDQVETIHKIYIGRHLQLFTETAEWYVETRTLDATQPVNVLLATRHGLKSSVPLTFADGGTLFVQRGGRTLRDFVYTDAELSYKAEPLSLLGAHLITNVVDVAHRQAANVREGNQILLVNETGPAVMLTLLRAQEVIAMGPWTTAGQIVACGSDVNGGLSIIVERAGRDGGTDLYLERRDETHTLDAATRYAFISPQAVLGGLPFADGTEVYAWAGGDLVGPLTCAGGAVTLPEPVTEAVAGLAPPWSADLQTVREMLNAAQPFRPPGRIFAAELAVERTGDLWLQVNGRGEREVPLAKLDTTLFELPFAERLYTGYASLANLRGFSEHPRLRLFQKKPAPVTVKSLRYEVSHHG